MRLFLNAEVTYFSKFFISPVSYIHHLCTVHDPVDERDLFAGYPYLLAYLQFSRDLIILGLGCAQQNNSQLGRKMSILSPDNRR
jgi:hypothetical protein